MHYYLQALQQYAVFEGRSSRKAYWQFVLFNILFTVICSILDAYFVTGGILNLLYLVAVFVPGIALCVRRLHDINRSGWWVAIGIVPILGVLFLLFFTLKRGDDHENRYGLPPMDDFLKE